MRRAFSVSTLLSIVIGTLVVVLVAAIAVSGINAWKRERDSVLIMSSARQARAIVLVREAARVELGVIDTTISEQAPAGPATLARLKELHKKTLAAIGYVENEIGLDRNQKLPPQLARRIRAMIKDFDGRVFPAVLKAAQLPRERRPANLTTEPAKSIYGMLEVVDAQAQLLSRQIAGTGPYMSEMMRISDIAWRMRVLAGNQRRVYGNYVAWPHKLTLQEREQAARVEGGIEAPWQAILHPLQDIEMPAELTGAIAQVNRDYFGRYARLRHDLLGRLDTGVPLGVTGPVWLKLSNPALSSLMAVSRASLNAAEARAAINLSIARHDVLMALIYMLVCIGLAIVAGLLVSLRIIRPLKQITHAITSNQDDGIEQILALSARGDEIGQFALALKTFRKIAADRQRLESEVVKNQAAAAAAQAASKIKSEFLANMSHELRTPLNAVIGFSDMMLHKTFGPLPVRYEEYAKLINQSGNHLLSLVSDILDLAKIEAGRFQADFRTFDLAACVEECMPVIRPKAQEREVVLAASLPDKPVLIVADQRACKQILINLLSNAVKFSHAHDTVTVSLVDLGEVVQMTVKDEGIGIPAKVLERIGQPFEQATNNPVVAREGTGLGLSVVKALVGEHGGEMKVDSREDEGTTVTIILPKQQECREAQAA